MDPSVQQSQIKSKRQERWWNRVLVSILTGFVFYFFSEIGFWANPRALRDLPGTWLVYSYAAYLFYWGLSYFQVKDKYGVFLLGCLYGWLIEGVIVYTVYENLPFSIAWTGMAWHALITVLLGFFGFEASVRRSGKTVFLWSVFMGLFYGSWATYWWVADGDERFMLHPSEFALFILGLSAGLVLAFSLMEFVKVEEFTPSKTEMIIVLLVFLFFFIVWNVILQGLPFLVLTPLGVITWYPLEQQRKREKEKTHLLYAQTQFQEDPILKWFFETPIPRKRMVLALFLPSSAIAYYAVAYQFQWRMEWNWIVFIITVPTSMVFYGMSWMKLKKESNPRSGEPKIVESE